MRVFSKISKTFKRDVCKPFSSSSPIPSAGISANIPIDESEVFTPKTFSKSARSALQALSLLFTISSESLGRLIHLEKSSCFKSLGILRKLTTRPDCPEYFLSVNRVLQVSLDA